MLAILKKGLKAIHHYDRRKSPANKVTPTFERNETVMNKGKELRMATGIAIALFIVGVASFGYSAFSVNSQDQPIRVVYKTVTGKVWFDHQTHTSDSGYGVSCGDCHHHPPDDEAALIACRECHRLPAEGETVVGICLDCHDESDIEDAEVITAKDAAHEQCTGCHQDVEAGPAEIDNCYECHIQ